MVRVDTIGQYNTPDVVEKSLRLEAFLVRDYADTQEELYDFAVPRLRSGALPLILVRAIS